MGFRLKDKRYIDKMIQFHKRNEKEVVTELLEESKQCVRCEQIYELTPRGLIDNFGGIAEIFVDEEKVILYPICKTCYKEYKQYRYWNHEEENEKEIMKQIAEKVKN